MSADKITFKIEKQEVDAPVEWEDVKVLATFDNGNNQANITTDRFTFVGNAKDAIVSFRKQNGVFQGPCFDIFASDEDGAFQISELYLDYTRDYEEQDFKSANFEDPNKVLISAQKVAGLNSLEDLIEGTTMGLLLDEGVFINNDYVDIDWVVQKKFDFIEFSITAISLYLMINEAIQAIKEIQKDVANFISKLTNNPPGGQIGAVIFQALVVAAQVAYTVLIIAQIIALAQDLLNTLLSPKRTHKGIYLGTALTKIFDYFGYNFVSPIEELDKYAYLPTLPLEPSNFADTLLSRVKVIKQGIPSVRDYGYLVSEFIELCLRLFNARLAIVDGVNGKEVQMRWIDDPWWFKQSNLDILDDKLIERVKFNTQDLSKNVFLRFLDDQADDWTIDNYTGTSYEVITNVKTVRDPKKVNLRGVDDVTFPVALGTPKSGYSTLEEDLLILFSALDNVINFFGGNANFSKIITSRIDILKLSQEEHQVPKLLYLINGKIPQNHRQFLSAKYLYDNYHIEKSFIDNNFKKQRVLFDSERVPFRFRDFKQLIENNSFITPDGKTGRITRCEWTIGADFAIVDGWFEKIYDKNLTQVTYEP